ncbi:hypothetical protein J7J13_00300 [bacterium]|nr:hypothetical protein [bacterium]
MFNQQQKLSAYFFILALILSAVFCFLFLENFKSYRSQITVLFIPKSEKIAIQSEQITQNLTELPRNLSFYEKLLNDNKNITDEFVGHTKDKREKLWNKKLKINRQKNSGLIEIGISDNNRIRSEKIVRQTVFTLFNTASRYYNIKNEIDLRVIDGPITDVKIKNWPWLIFLSVLAGTFLSYLITSVFSKVENFSSKAKSGINLTKHYRQDFSNWTTAMRRKDRIKKSNKPEKKPESAPSAKKSQAPSNLPIANEPDTILEKVKNNKSVNKIISAEEPSEEELKERLNQLLRGEL